MMQHGQSRVVLLAVTACVLLILVGCVPVSAPETSPQPQGAAEIANPASVNCIQQGGTLSIETRGDGGEYGVCVFEDNLQCEEWALFRDECPVGGVKITGYVTDAARFCAITGGEYQVKEDSSAEQEQGTCTFTNGKTCDVWEYYDGTCDRSDADSQSTYDDPFAYCAAAGTIDTPDDAYTGDKLPDSVVKAMVRQDIVSADAPKELLQGTVWRCMDASVWICIVGANIPCQEKADTSETPSSDMDDYCTSNQASDFIPAVVTGRSTVYEWACKDGEPTVVKQILTPDPQGYLAEFWDELTP